MSMDKIERDRLKLQSNLEQLSAHCDETERDRSPEDLLHLGYLMARLDDRLRDGQRDLNDLEQAVARYALQRASSYLGLLAFDRRRVQEETGEGE